MSRLVRLTAVAALAASAFATTPASAEFPPECKVTLEDRLFSGPGGGTWSMTYPVVTCTL